MVVHQTDNPQLVNFGKHSRRNITKSYSISRCFIPGGGVVESNLIFD
jgi:hypothetical protein